MQFRQQLVLMIRKTLYLRLLSLVDDDEDDDDVTLVTMLVMM